MTTAQAIKTILDNTHISAYTLTGGYAINQFTGARTLFPTSTESNVRRNERGRCTYSAHTYADGSKLIFTYSDNHGAKLQCRL